MSDYLIWKNLDLHNSDRPIVVLKKNYSDGASTGWHSHPRGQLLYAIEGVMLVQSAEGSWVVPSNRALWITAGLNHEVKMSGDVKMRTVYIDEVKIEALPEKTCVINVSPLLRELIVAAVQVSQSYSEESRDGRLMRLLVDELRISDVLSLHLPMPHDVRIKFICESLIDQPSDSYTAAQWSRQLGVTTKTVHRLFLKETGMTFSQWREQARLLYALRKIASGERIIDIAFDCGYASQSAFTAMFRRHFGITPSNFYR
ncbi:helix-turn-helix domain-containing protein [Geobacter sp. AOG2]|uniref:AraC family transcriptional regulator n=1 Tax=Geobacter sp. AOG2 TaxID=1566347 RepID=UPI001CC73B2E|nr:helix-turn-helix transcriptional regulator [Geobacter sp. AOG2]GFE61758.1 AraC family transcriptional regulator [Geobacter sp. AOG2]